MAGGQPKHTNGYWSTPDHPAITALALVAFKGDPTGRHPLLGSGPKFVKRGYDYLLDCVQPDGGIYKQDLVNYNTAVSIMALVMRNRPEDRPVLVNARNFLIGLQSDFDEPGKLDNAFDGGIGYGSKYKHSDMSNTSLALEALYHSRRLLEEEDPAAARELNWPAAIHFIERCQNLPSHNPEKWASDDPENKGGFVYYPGHSMAGETNLPSGRVALRSYGSMSYAGLLSYIYAELKRDDPRVIAVMDWLRDNFTLEENPGMGEQGLFYYFHTMAKALTVYGADYLETKDGKRIDWRERLALKLINLQKPDGSWANDNGRWWEKDPALVTAYSVIALEMVYRKL
jgi:squalene-hopene/tetraprenyl-beta-curcumene cyclase